MTDGPGYLATAKVITDAAVRKNDRNAVIEECARVAEGHWTARDAHPTSITAEVGNEIAGAIRALKEKP